jgi:HEPN domain-containing protein
MNKEEHIKHWQKSAEESWDSATYLAKGKYYSLSLFALHLSLEKLLKALWIKESVIDTPPYTHDLQKLCDELRIEISAEDYDFLSIINSWNIRGRYPDYTKRLYQNATDAYLKEQIGKVEILKKWLEEKILKQK